MGNGSDIESDIEDVPGAADARWHDPVVGLFLRLAAGGWVPAGRFEPRLPAVADRTAREGRLSLEIVSHCWQYAHLLAYQLSSLVLSPPQDLDVTMTVYYCEEDPATSKLLDRFGDIEATNVRWNWRALPREWLFDVPSVVTRRRCRRRPTGSGLPTAISFLRLVVSMRWRARCRAEGTRCVIRRSNTVRHC
ncbi:MAG: hypothetical protein U5O39_02010 [Gammaproteobacteria bacterium]|nr:hypothetical protein [Gammaproteobacteria bacterium]